MLDIDSISFRLVISLFLNLRRKGKDVILVAYDFNSVNIFILGSLWLNLTFMIDYQN